jgi:predicted lactoylglutathione lyase
LERGERLTLPPQLNFITLACRDVERMADFFRALDWPESPASERVHRVFQLRNGVVLALYGAENYERHYGPRGDGFRGFTLSVNVGSRDEMQAAHRALSAVDGVADLDDPVDSEHGFSGFSFRDPEGNIWDVVWKHGSLVDQQGHLTFDP